ncbi:MAG: hypothetical protein JNK82_31730 [Myxococcaceae bacterium]|nr:hypothetical protein [Myxococcaceae bacterium]
MGLLLGGVAGALVLWLWPKKPKDPEAEVRALVARIVAGAEARDLGPLSDAMSEKFRGPGGTSKQEVKQIVAWQVLRNQETVAVFNPSLTVTVRGQEDAELEGVFLFARTKVKRVDELQPEMVGSAYTIKATLDKYDGEWKFTSATYERTSWP